MKLLKFRIWNKGSRKFLDNSASLHCYSQWMIDAFTGEVWDATGTIGAKNPQVRSLYKEDHYWSGMEVIKVSPMVVQQFTGLKDIKGIEIYEGDIVSGICLNAGLSFAVVGFDTWGIFYTKTDEYVKGVEPYHGCCLITQETAEVMGNIFENSDLLKD